MQIEQILQRLEAVKPTRNGFMARCPVATHEDRNPSLSIRQTGDKILLHCFGACSTPEVLSAMNCSMKDLHNDDTHPTHDQPPIRPHAGPNITHRVEKTEIANMHQCLDLDQRTSLRDERMLSDEIIDQYQLGIVEMGGESRLAIPITDEIGDVPDIRRWLWPKDRTAGAPKILHWAAGYGSPRLFPFDQLAHDELVVVEGELDALALISHGIPAITVTAGASTWPDELSRYFAGKHVTILMDCDNAGRLGGLKRAASLCGHTTGLRIAAWPQGRPEGHDATDELKLHGTENLSAILQSAKPYARPASSSGSAEAMLSFPLEALAEPLQRLCIEGAEAIQCPPDYLALPSLVLVGAAIGRTRCLTLKNGWDEYGALYAAVIADPGAAKSPAMKQAVRPMMDRALALSVEFNALQKRYEREIQQAKSNATTADRPIKPHLERIFVSDITVESLAKALDENPRGILLYRDELSGWAQAMNAYKGGKGSDRQFFLSAWSGTPHPVDRKSQDSPLFLSHPHLSIVGTIQPDTLKALLHSNQWDDGLMDRILFAYPDVVISTSWSTAEVTSQTRQDVDLMYTRLYGLIEEPDQSNITLTEPALDVWTEWFAENQQELRYAPDQLRGVLAKMPSQCGRLILITHLARWAAGESVNPNQVDAESAIKATRLAQYFKNHARRAHGVIYEQKEARLHRKVLDWIRRRGAGGIRPRDLQRAKVGGIERAADAQKILDTLVESGAGQWRPRADRGITKTNTSTLYFFAEGESTVDE